MTLPVATIDTLAFGGNGVCRIEGKVCFVPFSCPGDKVVLRVTSRKKSYCSASIAEIIINSPARTAPECSIFGRCGGCHWQHISYPVQLEQKRDILAETLWRGARVPAAHIAAAVPAEHKYGYRSRLQFKVAVKNGKTAIGFFRQGTHQVENAADGCLVAAPIINQTLNCFRGVLQNYPGIEGVTQLTVDAGDTGVLVFINQQGSITRKSREYLSSQTVNFWPCTGLFIKTERLESFEKIWGESAISYRMNRVDPALKPVELMYPPGGFAQVNKRQNANMLTLIRKLGNFVATDHLLDLYCGNGNFSIPLATEVELVVGVEGNSDSVFVAEHNREINKVANVSFFCDDAASGLQRLLAKGDRFDTVLLDPPRAGAADVVAGIAQLKPGKIIYVSCDPSTLARDCGMLTGSGYRVVTSVPVDMFPQTFHIESVTLLSR